MCFISIDELTLIYGSLHREMFSFLCFNHTPMHGPLSCLSSASNLANMKQMMQCEPDLSIPTDLMIITEHEADGDGGFKTLELSATRNCMLLECEISRISDTNFQ